MKKSGIYQIRCTKTGKTYIGQTRDLDRRLYEHKRNLIKGEHHNQYLQRAFEKYGESHFEFSVIEECSVDDLDSREVYWITQFNSMMADHGFNLEAGGNVGKIISEQTKEKKRGSNNPMYGKHLSNEHIESLRIKNRGQNSNLSESQVEEMKLKLLQGVSIRKLSEDYGITTDAVLKIKIGKNWGYIRSDLNDDLKEMVKKESDERDDKIRQMESMGISRAKIAKAVGCTPATVTRVLGQKSNYYISSTQKMQLKKDIEQDYLKGLSQTEIMEKYDISHSTYTKMTSDVYNAERVKLQNLAVQMRKSGIMVRDIANHLGVARTTITRWTTKPREYRDNRKK